MNRDGMINGHSGVGWANIGKLVLSTVATVAAVVVCTGTIVNLSKSRLNAKSG